MNRARTKNKGVTQTSNRNAVSNTTVPLQPKSENITKPGRSTPASSGLDTSVGPPNSSLSHKQIAERAKAIWERKSRVTGQDQVNWCEAEAQLRAELQVNGIK
jgi:hypothetical protein